jgi:hypothetical protein
MEAIQEHDRIALGRQVEALLCYNVGDSPDVTISENTFVA